MVAAIAAPIATALGSLGMAASTATFAANVVVYTGITAAQYFITKAMQPEQEDPGVRGQVEFGEDVPQSIILGETATAGSLVYANVWGGAGKTPNAYLVQVYCVSDMPVTAIDSSIWVNNKNCTISGTLDNPKGYVVSDFTKGGRDNMWVKFLDGTQTSADSYLTSKFGSHATHPWTTDMIGRGRALVIVTTRYDEKQFSGIPTFLFRIQGAKLYDPRLDGTNGGSGSHRYATQGTHAYSQNPKVIDYNITRGIYYGSEWLFGGQASPAYRFDNSTWFAAMNECDATVTLRAGGTEPKYRIGVEVRLADRPLDLKDRIDLSCLGRSSECGGIFKTAVGAVGSSVFSFTDDNLIISQDRSASMFPGHENWVNTIRAKYIRPSDMWQQKEIAAKTNSSYVTADGGQILEKTVTFDMVRSGSQAQRLAKAMLEEVRRFRTHIIALPPNAKKVEPLDVVSWTSARYGYTSKKFIVGEVNRSRSGIVVLTLREADPNDLNWTPATDEDLDADTVFGDLDAASDTLAITVTAVSLKNNAGANKRPALRVTWTVDDEITDVKGIVFQVRDASTNDVVQRVRTDDWEDGQHTISGVGILKQQNYQVRARWVPRSDREVAWSAWTSVTAPNTGDDDDYTPSVPSGLALTYRRVTDEDGKTHSNVQVDWNADSNARTVYGIRVSDGTDTWHLESDDNRARFHVRTGITYSVQVRAISPGGTKTALCTAVTITPTKNTTPPATPTGFTLVLKPRGQRLSWDDPPELDYKRTLVYRNTTNNSATATLIGRVHGTHFRDDDELTRGTVYYYWIKHRNNSGTDSAFSSVQSASHRGVVVGDVEDDAVTTAKVLTGNVTKRDQSSNYGTKTVGTVYEQVLSVTANHGSNAEGVTLIGQFRCNGAGPIQVRITKGGGTIVLEAISTTVESNEWFCIHDNDPSVSGSSTTYDFEVRISSGTFQVEFRKFTAISFKR